MDDSRTFHYTASTGLAACGQRLGPLHLGNGARGLLQVAEQYPELACGECAEHVRARLALA